MPLAVFASFSEHDPSIRLTVVMANRLPLEQQTGADLIYFNEVYRSVVIVHYQAIEKRDEETEFRWQANDQFSEEIDRMEGLLEKLRKIPNGRHPDGSEVNFTGPGTGTGCDVTGLWPSLPPCWRQQQWPATARIPGGGLARRKSKLT